MACGVLAILSRYKPVLAGTIPLDIDIEGSDLDVICEVYQHGEFREVLESAFGRFLDFSLVDEQVQGLPTTICRFTFDGFPVEIFGQALPVERQNAYLHMVVEYELLCLHQAAREAIRALKRLGYKTEPAFAKHFGLLGDPYRVLLEMAKASLTREKLTTEEDIETQRHHRG